MPIGTRRTLFSGSRGADQTWWEWLDANFTVQIAYEFRGATTAFEGRMIGYMGIVAGSTTFNDDGMVCNDDSALNTNVILKPAYSFGAVVADAAAYNGHTMGSQFSTTGYDYYLRTIATANTLVMVHGAAYIGSGLGFSDGFYGFRGNSAMKDDGYLGSATASYDAKSNCYVGASSRASAWTDDPYTGTISAAFITAETLSADEWSELYERITNHS